VQLSRLAQSTAVGLWQMGQILAEAQERLAGYGTGTFQQWLEEETSLSLTTAYRLINVYKAFEEIQLAKTQIATTALYLLSEPSVPIEARHEALQRAERGEPITRATAQAIVATYAPPPPTELTQFEHDHILPHLHDAGNTSAPQMLSGVQAMPEQVPEDLKEHAAESLRASILEVLRGVRPRSEESLNTSADEILAIAGQQMGNLAIAARFGAELTKGPHTLTDLTDLAIWACGACKDGMDRAVFQTWRKRTLRVLTALTYCGGLCLFQHTLENGQLVYGLTEAESETNG